MAPQKRKRRYYIFLGDLYLSKDGKDRKIRKATEKDKKNVKSGIVEDTIKDMAEGASKLFSSKDEKKQRQSPTKTNIAERIGKAVSDQFSKRKKLFGSQDYRKGGMVINTTDNRKNK